MAPKKAQKTGNQSQSKAQSSKDEHANGTATEKPSDSRKTSSTAGKKRKANDDSSEAPSKSSRRSARSAPAGLSSDDQIKLLNFLLSPECVGLARPADEKKDVEARGGDAKLKTYSMSAFTPLEELISAMILSRPIGHMLGQRSIRTLFNPPHNLNTLRAIRKAGYDGVRAALDEARTQHRQKTAEQLVALAHFVAEGEGMNENDTSLEGFRDASDHDAQEQRDMLQKQIKGVGKTGLDIFGRRIQGLWEEWYPFGDKRTLEASAKLGLPEDAEGLKELVEGEWKKLSVPKDLTGSEDEKKRKTFVRVLERVVGADLEGNLDEVRKAALK